MLNSADLLKTVNNGNVIIYPCELLVCDAQGQVATVYDINSYHQMVEQIVYLSNETDIMYKVVQTIDCNEEHAIYPTDLPF